MSGEPSSATYDQAQHVELTDATSADASLEAPDEQIGDPIVSFLEKHGSTLVADHEGLMVTVAEAMANCPPFARMVAVMGESALFLVAGKHAKEETEDEPKEPEAEEAEDKTESKTQNPDKAKPAQPEGKKAADTEQQAANNITSEKNAVTLELIKTENPALEKSVEAEAVIKNEVTLSEAPAAADGGFTESAGTGSVYNQNPEPAPVIKPKEPSAFSTTKQISKSQNTLTVRETIVEPVVEVSKSKSFAAQEVSPQPEAAVKKIEDKPAVLLEAGTEINYSLELEAMARELEDEYNNQTVEEHAANSIMEVQQLPEEPERLDFYVPEQPLFIAEESEEAHDSGENSLLVLQNTEYESLQTELPVSVEEIEMTISELTEKMENLEPRETETSVQILDQIDEAPAKLKASAEGEFINEKEVQEELEELFTDLFDELEVEYTPELIDAFVSLSLKPYFEEAKEIEVEDEAGDNDSQNRGTHEIIRKILTSITDLKKTLANAYLIGRSAVRLYTLQYTT